MTARSTTRSAGRAAAIGAKGRGTASVVVTLSRASCGSAREVEDDGVAVRRRDVLAAHPGGLVVAGAQGLGELLHGRSSPLGAVVPVLAVHAIRSDSLAVQIRECQDLGADGLNGQHRARGASIWPAAPPTRPPPG